ncbi:MAG: GYF domain-containing protein, partial [Pirellulaceae bacterium]
EGLASVPAAGQPRVAAGPLRPGHASAALPPQPAASASGLPPKEVAVSAVQATASRPAKPTPKLSPPPPEAVLAPSRVKPSENPPRQATAGPSSASPQASNEAWYIVRPPSGGEYGPASQATVEAWISQRRVTADTLVCKVGTTEWKNAKEVFLRRFLFPS